MVQVGAGNGQWWNSTSMIMRTMQKVANLRGSHCLMMGGFEHQITANPLKQMKSILNHVFIILKIKN